ncbi:transmembrane anchor protein [Acinetobacter baumannii]|uniref:Transmembrane anchor protein n=2 Tax=Acinetobacter TaxID=469 RepID=A0AA42MXF2_ACIJO|nr:MULTISPECIES: hypothetical protein [Acinetobacter]KQD18426.1 transmembrane anchor protein [Acinetobacter baumannii]KRJ23603.1 transmembrane anchor protein [Acinetobacter baumannii]MBS5991334.1 transmembrane anchor protein [Acinetobacter baumannii]MCI3939791.1 transmembrane anchor protein [Acinetobacter baumannii]MCT9264265.1 transmembrane anchor protein [Acinetobacter baumannii]
MYNTQIPQDVELPSTKKLVKSTIIAAVSAAVVLVTVVMPAEYNIDPTGVGKVLGLTTMGEIKQSLAQESENGMGMAASNTISSEAESDPNIQSSMPIGETEKMTMPAIQKQQMTIELKPGQATEIKLAMPQSASVNFKWTTSGGGLNYDTHGDPVNAPKDFYHGYGKGRNETQQSGTIKAAFDGQHGWFWRNRTESPVSVTLEVEGQFSDMKKVF